MPLTAINKGRLFSGLAEEKKTSAGEEQWPKDD